MRLSEADALAYYTRIIQKEFFLSETEAKEWAGKFFAIIDSKGGDPYETDDSEEDIRIIVGSWLKNKNDTHG